MPELELPPSPPAPATQAFTLFAPGVVVTYNGQPGRVGGVRRPPAVIVPRTPFRLLPLQAAEDTHQASNGFEQRVAWGIELDLHFKWRSCRVACQSGKYRWQKGLETYLCIPGMGLLFSFPNLA